MSQNSDSSQPQTAARPRFSAIIPLYNKRRTIARSLASIGAQELPADEIIVVNDNSTDGSDGIVDSLGIPNLRRLDRTEPGPGGYAGRNLGASEASSEWLTFLDADDEWLPNHLAEAARVIRDHPEVGIIFFGRSVSNSSKSGQVVSDTDQVMDRDSLLAEYARRNLFHVNSLVIRKEVFAASGGFRADRGWRRGGDSELWLRLIDMDVPIYVSSKVTSIYDMTFSEVIRHKTNFVRSHPVHDTVRAMLRRADDKRRAALLKRLSNRKTTEWLAQVGNRKALTKLSLLCTIYVMDLSRHDALRIAKSLLVNW